MGQMEGLLHGQVSGWRWPAPRPRVNAVKTAKRAHVEPVGCSCIDVAAIAKGSPTVLDREHGLSFSVRKQA